MEPHMPAEEPALPASVLGGEEVEQIPDYLECLREARKREKDDDELLAQGKLPPAMAEAEAKLEAKRRKALAKKNTGVYVTGLPVDTEEDEFVRFMTKYGGLIKKDAETRRPVVKLYKDDHGTFTGEALVLFFRPESIEQSLTLINGMEFRPGFPLSVTRSKRAKKDATKAHKRVDKRIKRYDQEKNELGWDEEEDKLHVIVSGFFTLDEARQGGFDFFHELKAELEEELGKMGALKSVKIFEHNPNGVVAIKYEDPLAAQRCVDRMDGRFFAGRTLSAHFYDGFTNYEVKETDEDRERRVAEFGKWLGAVEDNNDNDNGGGGAGDGVGGGGDGAGGEDFEDDDDDE